jgi:hypothetical protein
VCSYSYSYLELVPQVRGPTRIVPMSSRQGWAPHLSKDRPGRRRRARAEKERRAVSTGNSRRTADVRP